MMFDRIIRKNKNILYLYISQIISKALYFILAIFISRYLGVMGLGQYASSFAIAGIFFIFVNAGFDNLLIREISLDKNKARRYLLDLIMLKACLGLLVFLLFLYLSDKVGPFRDIKYLILILIFSNLIDSSNQIFYCISIGYEKIKYSMAMFILKDTAIVGLSMIFLMRGGVLLQVMVCSLIGSIVYFISGIILVSRLKIKFAFQKNFLEILELIKKNAPFSLAFIFSFMLFKADLIILKLLKGNDAVGLFRAGTSFLVNLEVFPSFFMLALYPKLSRLAEKNKPLLIRMYNKSFFYILVLNLIMLLPLFIFSRSLILLVFGNKFAGSAEILRYMSVPVFFLFQNACNAYFLNAVNRPDFNAFIFCLGSVLNIILDFILIPAYGYYGVLIATAVSYSLIFILSSYVIETKIVRPYFKAFA